jgi:hypothetical protein
VTAAFTLCRLSQAEAEHLMMAPAMAGGWIAVHPDCRDAVAEAMGGRWAGNWADCLALLPSAWDDGDRRAVAPDLAERIIAALAHAARYPAVSEDGSEATEIAGRVRAHLAQAVAS